MMATWFSGRHAIELPCTVDLEQTTESLHAYVELDGFEIRAGDRVFVNDAPTHIEFGKHIVYKRRATIVRANIVGGMLARLKGYLELTELYEVSFSGGRVS
jgi:hypothetical protein